MTDEASSLNMGPEVWTERVCVVWAYFLDFEVGRTCEGWEDGGVEGKVGDVGAVDEAVLYGEELLVSLEPPESESDSSKRLGSVCWPCRIGIGIADGRN
jgi:hypothetical protein